MCRRPKKPHRAWARPDVSRAHVIAREIDRLFLIFTPFGYFRIDCCRIFIIRSVYRSVYEAVTAVASSGRYTPVGLSVTRYRVPARYNIVSLAVFYRARNWPERIGKTGAEFCLRVFPDVVNIFDQRPGENRPGRKKKHWSVFEHGRAWLLFRTAINSCRRRRHCYNNIIFPRYIIIQIE